MQTTANSKSSPQLSGAPRLLTLGEALAWSKVEALPLRADAMSRGLRVTVVLCDGKLVYARFGSLRGHAALDACAEADMAYDVERLDAKRVWRLSRRKSILSQHDSAA